MEPFLKKLSESILVCDGAMGTMLYSKGIYLNKCFDELNLTSPQMVEDVHRLYVEIGVDIIETNTFGANRFRLLPFGLDGKVSLINKKAVSIAKAASGGKCYVAGSVGSISANLKPIGNVSREEVSDVFKEQIESLLEGGVDLLILETFSGIEMLRVAIEVSRDLTKLPIIAQVTVNDWGNTLLEETPEKVVRELENSGADVLGANCSVGPSVMLDSLSIMREKSSIYLSAMPNAGLPKLVDGRFIYLCSPEYMAEFAKRFIQSGVNIIGGCCGTTPEHIKAIISAVKAIKPKISKIETAHPITVSEKVEIKKESRLKKKSLLEERFERGEFVKCVEMDPPRGFGYKNLLEWTSRLLAEGVHAVNIADGPRATARMSPIALASLIKNNTKMDVILHFCCRDRNLLGMQSDLLGSYALGINNILAVTGDPPKLGDYPSATAVFDVDSIGLLKIASNLNRGVDVAGSPLGDETSFYLSAALNFGAINMDEELKRLELKIESGARYLMTQPIFDIGLFEKSLKLLEGFAIPVMAGVMPLYSLRNAEFLNNEVPGMTIPDNIMARMKNSANGESVREEGSKIASEILTEIRGMVQGVYVMPPFGKYELALKVLKAI